MRYLPVSLDTEDKKILILGGGYLAFSALKSVIDTEAEIYILSQKIFCKKLKIHRVKLR